MNIHQAQVHPEYVEDCFMCKISTVSAGTGTNITGKGAKEAEFSRKMEARLEKDRPAYKAMKKQGLQPARLTGAHELMTKAETSYEIESGNLMPGKAKEIETLVKEFKDATGKKPTETTAVLA